MLEVRACNSVSSKCIQLCSLQIRHYLACSLPSLLYPIKKSYTIMQGLEPDGPDIFQYTNTALVYLPLPSCINFFRYHTHSSITLTNSLCCPSHSASPTRPLPVLETSLPSVCITLFLCPLPFPAVYQCLHPLPNYVFPFCFSSSYSTCVYFLNLLPAPCPTLPPPLSPARPAPLPLPAL